MTVQTKSLPTPSLALTCPPVAPPRQSLGFACVLAGAFLFALVFALPKLSGTSIGLIQIAFFRFGCAFLMLAPLLALPSQRRRLAFNRGRLLHSLRSVLAIVSLIGGVYAAQHMLLADAMVLSNTKSVFAILLAALLLGEVLTKRRIFCVGLALLGATVVVQPSGATVTGILANPAALAALAGAAAMGIEAVMLRYLSTRDGALAALVYFNGTAALLLLLAMPFVWEAPSPRDWLFLAAMGPIALLGNFANIQGYQRVEAVRLAPFSYSMMIFSALIGWLCFAELPGPATWAGGLLIALAGWWSSRERR